MFHLNTELLIDYWRSRRVSSRPPARADIDPVELGTLLPHMFMAGRHAAGRYALRLAGGYLDKLHARELHGEDLCMLWSPDDRDALRLALEAARRKAEPLVVDADAVTQRGPPITLEVFMAPLIGPSGEVDRLMGCYQPISGPPAFGALPVRWLTLRTLRAAGEDGAGGFGALRLAAVDGRRIA
jgi:hypothetical protein